MKWGFGVRNKITLSVILFVIFAITLIGNLISKNHVNELGSSFSSVYEDRLVVESYIYRLSEILHQKKIMIFDPGLSLADRNIRIKKHNTEIANLLDAYDKTKLTRQEALFLKRLKSSFADIGLQEEYALTADEHHRISANNGLQKELDHATEYLRDLSAIQLSEAQSLNKRSRNIVAGSTLVSEMGSAILIFSLLVVQVLIFSSRLTKQQPPVNYHLN